MSQSLQTLQNMETLVALAKSRGFVCQGSEIYGGLANTWDYGPLGVALKNNIRDMWWKTFVQKRRDIVGLDAAILMHPKVWEASGHVAGFSDPLIDCKQCHARMRADKMVEEYREETGDTDFPQNWAAEKTPSDDFKAYFAQKGIVCPHCGSGDFTDVRKFNLMFKTRMGVTEGEGAEIYLRPETAQGIFADFKAVVQAMSPKVPFGIAQVGKAFRNEITPKNFIFRTREFEQMEIEYFVKPGTHEAAHAQWEKDIWSFVKNNLKFNHESKLRLRWHDADELSHYSSGTFDIEYEYPFGWSELLGCASRTDFDLKQHMEHSGQDLTYFDAETNTRYVPYVIEPSFGLTRMVLAILCDAYHEETVAEGETRTVMRLNPLLAPYRVAVFPLVKKLSAAAEAVYEQLADEFAVSFDETNAIGKRYRRHDEIGTPFCVTIDYDTTGDGEHSDPALKGTVTVRHRDTMVQERVAIADLADYIRKASVEWMPQA